ncbi:hypothetical protein I7I48_08085 [Histoplasma ohiense]|nr:hypothetical protein I7I48_08085 [Histoplasma ohiense (nom. inval.)]
MQWGWQPCRYVCTCTCMSSTYWRFYACRRRGGHKEPSQHKSPRLLGRERPTQEAGSCRPLRQARTSG